MFSWELIAAGFLATFLAIAPIDWLENRHFNTAVKIILLIGLVAAVYSIFAGIHLRVGWEDPLAGADPETVGRVTGRRRGGIIILAIRFWPYVLIGVGGFFAFRYLRQFWYRR